MTLEINTARVGQATIIEINGRIDSINARQLETIIRREMARDHAQILLQVSDVYYMSAAGLRILRLLHHELGAVHLIAPSDRVREVLQITGLDTIYRMHPNRTDAVHAVNRVTNAHTHLELGWLSGRRPGLGGADFVQWINQTVIQGRRDLGADWEKHYTEAIEAGIQGLIDSGTTMVADISTSGKSIGPLLRSGLRGIVYIELLGTDPTKIDASLQNVQDFIAAWRPKTTSKMQIGLSLHAPYSVHSDLWRKALDYARAESLPLCIHAAESPAEHQFMTQGTGPMLDDYYSDILPAILSPGKTPVAFLEDIGALELKPLLVHMVQVDDDDIRRIKDHDCTVVHCPRSNLRLRCGRMPLEKFLANDIPVLLGTDSLGSAPSLSVFDEVEVAAALHHEHVKPREVAQLIYNPLPGMD